MDLPRSVSLTVWLLLLDAFIWLAFGLATAAGTLPSIPAGPVRWVMAALAVGCAAALFALALLLRRRSRPAYLLTVGLLAVTAALAFADQVGLLDLAALLACLAPLVLLLKDRAWYLRRDLGQPQASTPGGDEGHGKDPSLS
jgi:hypothetical protein